MEEKESAEKEKKLSTDIKFLYVNRARNNQTINRVLWGCILVGPLLALGIFLGVFKEINYNSCIIITIMEIFLASIHLWLYKKWPTSKVTSYFCLLFIDFLLFYMSYLKVGIHLSYFIVPLLSLFYCDKSIFVVSAGFNFVMMMLSLWFIAPFYSSINTEQSEALSWFLTKGTGFAIEYFAMVSIGIALGNTINRYYHTMYEDKKVIRKGEKVLKEIEERAEELIQISKTDKLTGLLNRRAYEEDLNEFTIQKDLVVGVIDINGLKITNDRKGHDAGDEMIVGTAECIKNVFGKAGKTYRIGGDEFVVLFRANKDDLLRLKENFIREISMWEGEKIDKLSMSIGFAIAADNEENGIYELVRLADKKMYAEKEEYYRITGNDRRKY